MHCIPSLVPASPVVHITSQTHHTRRECLTYQLPLCCDRKLLVAMRMQVWTPQQSYWQSVPCPSRPLCTWRTGHRSCAPCWQCGSCSCCFLSCKCAGLMTELYAACILEPARIPRWLDQQPCRHAVLIKAHCTLLGHMCMCGRLAHLLSMLCTVTAVWASWSTRRKTGCA